MEIQDTYLIAAMAPGGGRNNITSRMVRHMNVIAIESFDDELMKTIFQPVINWHFTKYAFPPEYTKYSKMIVEGTLKIYNKAIELFLPTPSKSHYLFNLRDFARVIQGVLLFDSKSLLSTKENPENMVANGYTLIKLWTHEIYRVFGDRLVDTEDRLKLFDAVKVISTKYCFRFEIFFIVK